MTVAVFSTDAAAAGVYTLSYEVAVNDGSTSVVKAMNTDPFTFELVDTCLASSGLSINLDVPMAPRPYTYYYDGRVHTNTDGSSIVYGASSFSTSHSACPIVSYTCQ